MSEYVTSVRTYLVIFLALMALTAITVAIAFLELGPFNDIAAMGIAITKACLVILYFMHVRHSSRLTKVVVVAGFLWLLFLIGFTMSDYLTRGMISLQGTVG